MRRFTRSASSQLSPKLLLVICVAFTIPIVPTVAQLRSRQSRVNFEFGGNKPDEIVNSDVIKAKSVPETDSNNPTETFEEVLESVFQEDGDNITASDLDIPSGSQGSKGENTSLADVDNFEEFSVFGGRPITKAPSDVPEFCKTKRLFCPPGCNVSFAENGCPHNCNCGVVKDCPRVTCPLPIPHCLILTNLDGCQTCGCRDPVAIITSDDGNEKVVFLRLTSLESSPLTQEEIKEEEERIEHVTASPLATTRDQVLANAINEAQKHPSGLIVEIRDKKYHLLTKPVFPEDSNNSTDDPPIFKRLCTEEDKQKLDRAFQSVYSFLATNANPNDIVGQSFSFPKTFKQTKPSIKQGCVSYRNAFRDVSTSLVHKCKPQYKPVGDAVALMDYPCSPATQYGFNRYYDCIRGTSRNATMVKCQQSARSQIGDPFVNQCDAFNIMAECIFDPIVYLCGYAAWEVQYQYLSINVRQMAPTCRLKRINRQIETFPGKV